MKIAWYAIALYMITVPLAEARAQLSRLIDAAIRTHERVEVTRTGHRAAVLLGADACGQPRPATADTGYP